MQHAGIALDSVTTADALLVTSELVTNAIRHGGGLIAFCAEITGEALRVCVSDGARTLPRPGRLPRSSPVGSAGRSSSDSRHTSTSAATPAVRRS
ncbi:ATP-binding protein [Streptomyces sp. NBC_01264]|nr:ATP-binding protein [Streptomyces sp. NBC_01264]